MKKFSVCTLNNLIRLVSILVLAFCFVPLFGISGMDSVSVIHLATGLRFGQNPEMSAAFIYFAVPVLALLPLASTFLPSNNVVRYAIACISGVLNLALTFSTAVRINNYLIALGANAGFSILPTFIVFMALIYVGILLSVGGLLDLESRKNKRVEVKISDALFNGANITFFVLFTFICIFPFYYLFINTISNNDLVRTGQIKFIPQGIHFENYIRILKAQDLLDSLLVSVGRTVIGTVTMVVASAFIGYLVTKHEMWGRKFIYRTLVITMYFNAGLIPWYLNMSMLGLTNSFWAYIIPGIVAPYNIILVKTYIESIPAELEESAAMDGAGYLKIFGNIIWPLSKPILATIAIFGAVGHWNSFTDSMILMQNAPKLYTLQYRLYLYLNTSSNLSKVMNQPGAVISDAIANSLNNRTVNLTVSMVTMIPIILVYPFLQHYFEKGIMIGAVKG